MAYSDELSDTKAKLNIGGFSIVADSIDLNKMQFDLKSVDLNQSKVQLVLGKSDMKKQDKKEKAEKPGTKMAWMVNLANLNLVNDEFSFDDDGKKPIADAMDYAHLYIRNLNTSAGTLSLSSENYKGEIKMLSFSEKSGFELKRLSTGFYYSDQQARLNDLILLTNNTNLRNKTLLKYASHRQSV